MREVRYCSTCRHWPPMEGHCTECKFDPTNGCNTKWEPQYDTGIDQIFDEIIADLQREADNGAETGIIKAIEIVKKRKGDMKGGET